MKIRWSGLIADAIGKFGGSTIYNGRTGPVFRNIRKAKNPNTASQIDVRSAVRLFSGSWKNLDPTKIIAWNAAGADTKKKNAVGNSYTSSGFDLFIAVNCVANFFGITVQIDDPPLMTAPTINGNIANMDATGGITPSFLVDIPIVSTGDKLMLFATPQMSAGRSNAKGKFRPIKLFTAGAAQVGYDMLADYTAVFGTLTIGKKVFLSCQYYNIAGASPVSYDGGVELSGKIKTP